MKSAQRTICAREHRVLVTGGTGFVGRHVCAELLASGVRKENITIGAPGPRSIASSFAEVYFDLNDEDSFDSAIHLVKPTAIIHLAAIALPSRAAEDVPKTWRVNFDAPLAIGRKILECSPSTRFVYIGSAEAYGQTCELTTEAISEDMSFRPTTVYGATKAAADIALGQMSLDGLDVVRFRSFNHTGPGQSPNYVVSAFAQQVAKIEKGLQPKKIVVGNLDSYRDFTDVRDVARAYTKSILIPEFESHQRALNIASGVSHRIGDVLSMLIEQIAFEIEIEIDPTRLRQNETSKVRGNFQLAQQVLDWRPQIAFDTTVNDMLEYWRNSI